MRFALVLMICLFAGELSAKERFFQKGDVVALVGGEDMVAIAEDGMLETFLTLAHRGDQLKFRSLAKEGDTLYAQRRDVGFPDIPAQLDQAGATVVLCLFGKMECFAEGKTVENFSSAYRSMIERVAGEGKRRVMLLWPAPFEARGDLSSDRAQRKNALLEEYAKATEALCREKNIRVIRLSDENAVEHWTRNGVHFSEAGLKEWARQMVEALCGKAEFPEDVAGDSLLRLIAAKNKLWFHYTRPQNWAFLGGDRIEQPSSHDHIKTSYRWFPVEMQEYLPLIATKEKEIWELAEQLHSKEGDQ